MAVKALYGVAAVLVVTALAYAGMIAVVNGTAESVQDRAGIQASIPIAVSIALVALLLSVAAFLISRSTGRNE